MEKLYDALDIEEAVKNVADELEDLLPHDAEPIFLIVLSGAFMFAADLIREVGRACEVRFVKASSYGQAHFPQQIVQVEQLGPLDDLKGRHVVVIDDIYDTGATMATLLAFVKDLGAAAAYGVALLLKDLPDRKGPLTLSAYGLLCPNSFVVGYGMGDGERYRDLPHIVAIPPCLAE